MKYISKEQNKELEEAKNKFTCSHDSIEVRKRILTNGTIAYWSQCTRCGQAKGSAVKADKAQKIHGDKEIPLYDEDLKKSWQHAREVEYSGVMGKYEDKHEYKQAQFFKWYSEYLKSDEWFAKRTKVLLRSQGICEGCRDRDAAEVHHVSYRNVGDEFLFELVALCLECHDRFHSTFDIKSDDSELKQAKQFKKMMGN